MIYLQLFWEFLKIGLFAVGGGMATLPFLQDLSEKTGWYSQALITDMIAISESTPGPIGINMATYVGYNVAGFLGGIVATMGIVFPSLIIISALAGVINTFSHLAWVQHAFAGIRVCVCVLIFNAVVKLFKSAVKDWPAGVIFAVVLALALLTDLSPVVFVALAAAAGIVVQNLIRRNG